MSKILLNRRWNEVLVKRSRRLFKDDLLNYRAPQKEVEPFTNVRVLARLIDQGICDIEEGIDMALAMDGSGECGKFIYAGYDDNVSQVIEDAIRFFKITKKVALETVENMSASACSAEYIHCHKIDNDKNYYISLNIGSQIEYWKRLNFLMEIWEHTPVMQ